MKIGDFEIVNHGIENEQYFQGCGVAYTQFNKIVTGIGDSLYEAIDDCLDQIAMSDDIDNIDEIEKEIKNEHDNIGFEMPYIVDDSTDGIYYYTSIRYNLE